MKGFDLIVGFKIGRVSHIAQITLESGQKASKRPAAKQFIHKFVDIKHKRVSIVSSVKVHYFVRKVLFARGYNGVPPHAVIVSQRPDKF